MASIVKLKDLGMLQLNDPLSKYIPDYPNGNIITIEHLLLHRSGIVDFVNDVPYALYAEEISMEDIIPLFKDLPLHFKPGEKYKYSNSGYILLAYIIEKVSGMKYSEYVETIFFKKLGMVHTIANWNNIPSNQAKGYHVENNKFVTSNPFHPSQFVGGGNVISTVEDLYKWYKAVYKTGEVSAEYQWCYSGRIEGWTRTQYYFNEYADYVIILLSNYGDASLNEMEKHLKKYLIKFIRDEVNHTPADLKRFDGIYDFENGDLIYIGQKDDELYAKFAQKQKYEIFAFAKNEFFWRDKPGCLKFEEDKNGQVSQVVFRQNDKVLVAKKIINNAP